MQCHPFQHYFLFAPCCSVDPRRWLPWRHVVGVASRRLSLAAEKGSFIVPRRTGFRLQGKMFRNSFSFPENIGDWISQDPCLFCIGILLLLNYQVLLRCMRSAYSVICSTWFFRCEFVKKIKVCHENSWHLFNMASIQYPVSPWWYTQALPSNAINWSGYIRWMTSHEIPKVQGKWGSI